MVAAAPCETVVLRVLKVSVEDVPQRVSRGTVVTMLGRFPIPRACRMRNKSDAPATIRIFSITAITFDTARLVNYATLKLTAPHAAFVVTAQKRFHPSR